MILPHNPHPCLARTTVGCLTLTCLCNRAGLVCSCWAETKSHLHGGVNPLPPPPPPLACWYTASKSGYAPRKVFFCYHKDGLCMPVEAHTCFFFVSIASISIRGALFCQKVKHMVSIWVPPISFYFGNFEKILPAAHYFGKIFVCGVQIWYHFLPAVADFRKFCCLKNYHRQIWLIYLPFTAG